MKILSIDVGIKNLALCILETNNSISNNNNNNNGFIIRFWEVINLFEEEIKKCQFNIIHKNKKNKNKKDYTQCSKDAKFHKNGKFYCKTHAAKTEYKLPTSDLNKYKKMKLNELIKLTEDCDISISEKSSKPNKLTLIKNIESFIERSVFEHVSTFKCKDVSLIDIGIAIKENLDKLHTFVFSDIDIILIENQISPIANRMNCIQGMLSQYFIMKNMNNILFVSATNKLKAFIENKKTIYSERKKIGIEETKKLLLKMDNDNISKDKIIEKFYSHKKKDDLADCFLQAIWYIRRGEII
jgi:hypothetical protein